PQRRQCEIGLTHVVGLSDFQEHPVIDLTARDVKQEIRCRGKGSQKRRWSIHRRGSSPDARENSDRCPRSSYQSEAKGNRGGARRRLRPVTHRSVETSISSYSQWTAVSENTAASTGRDTSNSSAST